MNTRHVLAWLQWSTHKLEYGIRAYAREADWILSFMRNTRDFAVGSTQMDGLLVLPGQDKFDYRALYPNARIVNLHGMAGRAPDPAFDAAISIDHEQVSRLAADYLLGLGFRKFIGFGGKPGEPVATRLRGFRTHVVSRGAGFRKLYLNTWAEQIVFDPRNVKDRISLAIRTTGLPLAVFAPEDIYADIFIQAALDLGYRIPDDIAVLGVNNSREICENCRVSISSIDVNLSRLGYEGARLLDGLMRGDCETRPLVLIPPLTIEKRRSTDDSAEADRTVSSIRQYIREHLAERISLQTVLQDLRVSRSTAFARFTRAVGHSIGREIMLVRMEHARHLLLHSDYKIDAVAWMSGYEDSSAFGRLFKRLHHRTPSAFRKSGGG
ncbi:MAG: substrate-binding domain-containing protein, partial [Opitutaceae bacterium]|nr:substrate-binding domain-containing protein [Opitutaceae bacterium]